MQTSRTAWYSVVLIALLLASGGLAWNASAAPAPATPSSHSLSATPGAYPPYNVYVAFDRPYKLPGDAATLYINVFNNTNDGPQANVNSVFVVAYYTPTGRPMYSQIVPLNQHPTPSNYISEPFTVPVNASYGSTIIFTVVANASLPNGSGTEQGGASLDIGNTPSISLCPRPTYGANGNCYSSFSPGANFLLVVTAMVPTAGGNYPWADQNASAAFYFNGNTVTIPGFPSSMTTNTQGIASGVVQTTNLGTGSLNVTISMTDSNNPAIHVTVWTSVRINVIPSAVVEVQLNAGQYFGGDTVHSNFTLSTYTGGVPSGGWSATWWAAILYSDSYCLSSNKVILGMGTDISGTSGSLPSISIPVTETGSVQLVVLANNNTASTYGYSACAAVNPPELVVATNEAYYNPGDTITVSISTVGSVFNGATYFGLVSSGGVILYNATVSGTSFNFNIPKTGTLPSYTVTVVAQTTANGIISGRNVPLYENSGYVLIVNLKTPSSYATGTYQPGQTLNFGYTLTPTGNAGTPKVFTVNISFSNSNQQPVEVLETSTSGTFSVTIPSSAGNGIVVISFVATILGVGGAQTSNAVAVNGSPSMLDYTIFGAGTTFTVADLILLLVVLIGAILAVLIFRRRRQGGSSHKGKNAGVEQWNQQAPPADQQAPPAEPAPGYPSGADPNQPPYPQQ